MSVRSGQSITVLFTTRGFADGVAVDADSLPAGMLYVNGTADAATVTVTNITTGVYKAAVTMPTLAVGDVVDLRISATVATVADNAIIWRDVKDILLDSDGDVALADGVTHGGTSALLRLGSSTATPAFHVTNSGGDAVFFESTGGNGIGLQVVGEGSGMGMLVFGGATGMGLGIAGGSGQKDIGNAGGAITMDITGTLSGVVGGIAGATQTLDALQTALNTAHGAGSWLTGSGTSTLTTADIDARLAAYGGPTNAQMEARTLAAAAYATAANQTTIITHLTDVKGAAFSGATDSLEAIRDRGDSAWVTGAGSSPEDIADAVWDELGAGHVTASSMGALLALAATAADHIGTAVIETTSVISQAGDITIVKGDDYLAADGRAIDWTGASANIWPDLTGAAIKLNIGDGTLVVTGSVITPTGTQKVRAEPAAAQTAMLGVTSYTYDVTAVLANGHRITLIQGHVVVLNTDAS